MAGALVRADGRFLLHQRHLASAHGGLWEFPGGKIEGGESPERALARELGEELGIALECTALNPVGFAASPQDSATGQRPILIVLYACREWSGDPQCLEGEAIGWFAPDEIAGLAMPPLDVPLAARLIELLGAGLI